MSERWNSCAQPSSGAAINQPQRRALGLRAAGLEGLHTGGVARQLVPQRDGPLEPPVAQQSAQASVDDGFHLWAGQARLGGDLGLCALLAILQAQNLLRAGYLQALQRFVNRLGDFLGLYDLRSVGQSAIFEQVQLGFAAVILIVGGNVQRLRADIPAALMSGESTSKASGQ